MSLGMGRYMRIFDIPSFLLFYVSRGTVVLYIKVINYTYAWLCSFGYLLAGVELVALELGIYTTVCRIETCLVHLLALANTLNPLSEKKKQLPNNTPFPIQRLF